MMCSRSLKCLVTNGQLVLGLIPSENTHCSDLLAKANADVCALLCSQIPSASHRMPPAHGMWFSFWRSVIPVNSKQAETLFKIFFPSPPSSLQVYSLCSNFSPGKEHDSMADRNADPLVFCCEHPSNLASVSPGALIFLLTAKTNDRCRAVCSCLPKIFLTFLKDDLFFKHTWSFLSAVTYQHESRVRFVLGKPYSANPPYAFPLYSLF